MKYLLFVSWLLLMPKAYSQCDYSIADLINLFSKNLSEIENFTLEQGMTYHSEGEMYACADNKGVFGLSVGDGFQQIVSNTGHRSKYLAWKKEIETYKNAKLIETKLEKGAYHYVYLIEVEGSEMRTQITCYYELLEGNVFSGLVSILLFF